MSPFIKDNLFKSPLKNKLEAVKERGKTPPDVKKQTDNKTEDEKLSKVKNLNPFEDEDGNPLENEAPEIPESSRDSTDAKIEHEAHVRDLPVNETTQEPPQTSSNETPAGKRSPSASPVSLEFVSQADSDEMKSISHESSPVFVEEDGLRLRKDALLAIKAMEVDDYYSFLSAAEEFHTPMVEEKQLQDAIPAKTLPEEVVVNNACKVKTDEILTPGVHEDGEKTRENHKKELPPEIFKTPSDKGDVDATENFRGKLTSQITESSSSKGVEDANRNNREKIPPQVTEPSSNKSPVNTSTPVINKIDFDEGNQQTAAPALNHKNAEEVNSQPVVNGLSSMPAEVTVQKDAPRHTEVAPQPKKTPCEEVPPLKLGPSPYIESQDPPKPSPRTKKGRYGYSTVGGCIAPPVTPRGTTPSTREPSVGASSVSGRSDSPVKSTDNNLTTPYSDRSLSCKNELQRTPSDTGYAGTSTNYSGSSDAEPIYWEISEPRDAPPKPSPRNKKNQKSHYEAKPNQSKVNQPSPNLNAKEESQTKPVPEWINTRAPIPSPRGKKQRSMQSLPSDVPTDDTMESVKKKLQLLSHDPLPDITFSHQMPVMTQKQEEQFYSGKAASISYGFTPSRIPPPSPPLRGRKASQVSLPAAMATEDAQTRQQKRRSLYLNPDGEAVPQPPSPRRARRRTDPTQGTNLRSIESAVKVKSPCSMTVKKLTYKFCISSLGFDHRRLMKERACMS